MGAIRIPTLFDEFTQTFATVDRSRETIAAFLHFNAHKIGTAIAF
jgi:hypothetical protein